MLVASLFLCAAAHGAPSFMVGADRVAPGKDKVAVEFIPGSKIKLDAGFYDDVDGRRIPNTEEPGGTYDWQIRCGDDNTPCAGAALKESGGEEYLEVSRDAPANLRVFVKHVRDDGTIDGNTELDFAPPHVDGAPPAAAHPNFVGSFGALTGESSRDEWRHRNRVEPNVAASPASPSSGYGRAGSSGSRGSRGGGGGGGDDDDYSSYRSYRSRRSRRSFDDSYGGYGGGGGYGFGGGGSPTSKRGYNRDNEVPVEYCRNVTDKAGKNKVVCEDAAHKVLRLKKAKPKKPALAKKPAAKAAKKPVSLR